MLEFWTKFAGAIIDSGPWGIAMVLVMTAFGALFAVLWLDHKTQIKMMEKHSQELRQDRESLSRIVERNTEAYLKHSEVIASVISVVSDSRRMVERVHDRLDRK